MFHQTEGRDFYGDHNFKLFLLFTLQIFFWFRQTKEPEKRDYFLDHNIKLFLFFIRQLFFRFHQTKEPEERDYFGAHEFKLKGYPFACSGEEAIGARQLVSTFVYKQLNSLEALRT
jgi:hypothetical protein